MFSKKAKSSKTTTTNSDWAHFNAAKWDYLHDQQKLQTIILQGDPQLDPFILAQLMIMAPPMPEWYRKASIEEIEGVNPDMSDVEKEEAAFFSWREYFVNQILQLSGVQR